MSQISSGSDTLLLLVERIDRDDRDFEMALDDVAAGARECL